jgi:predicted Co/Zn/Cd cation transporter (cation efflux family)
MSKRKAIVDNFVNKYLSRKLIVFVISTFGLFLGFLTSGDFVIIAGIYISTQAVLDFITLNKGGGNDPSMM